jgi:hypothetical protein
MSDCQYPDLMISRSLVSILLALVFANGSMSQEITPLLNQNEKFTPSGKVYQDDLYGFPTFHEDGVLNGVQYRIYFLDGSGTFEGVKGNGIDRTWNKNESATEGLKYIADMKKNWKILCREDAVDILTCIMVIPGISIILNTKGQQSVAIHGDDGDPLGLIVGIRLENGADFEGGKDSWFVGETAARIIDGLKISKQVTTSFRRANDAPSRRRTLDLYGFNETFTYLNWLINKCKRTYNSREGMQPDLGGGGFQTCKLK